LQQSFLSVINKGKIINQLQLLKEALQEKYSVDCDQFVDLYEQGFNREEMEVELDCTAFKLRTVAAALNLRWAQKYRVNDLQLLLTRDTEGFDTEQADEIIKLKENALEYERELISRDKSLVKVRREANRLRSHMREESVDDTLIGAVEALTSEIRPMVLPKFTPHDRPNGTDWVLISDWHVGATVSDSDVPDNSYGWDTVRARAHILMEAAARNAKGDVFDFYIAGDMIDGLIHDSLEASDMNPAESAKELAGLLAMYVQEFSENYESVRVYCLNGNHSRLTDKKKSANKGFDFEFLCYSILEALTVNLVSHFEISTVGMISAEIAPGVFAGIHHGDSLPQTKPLSVTERFRQIGPDVSHVLQGHTHKFKIDALHTGGFYITNGSLIGTNAYVHTNGFIPVPTVQVIGSWTVDGQLHTILPVVVG